MKTIHTDRAPQAIGPYSQAVVAGEFVFTAGQIALDPVTGEIAATDVAGQTERVLNNLAEVLEAAGSGLSQVVKTTVFLADMADFAAVNAIYERFMPDPPPARSTVQAAALPKGGLVEIEAIARRER